MELSKWMDNTLSHYLIDNGYKDNQYFTRW
jgi:hypothetical protein